MEETRAGRVGLARLEPTDGEQLRRLFLRLSPETVYRRFLSPLVHPEQARPERLLDLDHHDREAVIAVLDGEIVGVARYARSPGSDSAELAVVVADDWQRQGLATRMLARLAELAKASGVRRFTATMHTDNRPVLRLLRRFAPDLELTSGQGVYEARLENPSAAAR